MSRESGDMLHNIDEQKQPSSERSTSNQMKVLSTSTLPRELQPGIPSKESSNSNLGSDSLKTNLGSERQNQSFGLDQSFELLKNSNTADRRLRRQDAFDDSS